MSFLVVTDAAAMFVASTISTRMKRFSLAIWGRDFGRRFSLGVREYGDVGECGRKGERRAVYIGEPGAKCECQTVIHCYVKQAVSCVRRIKYIGVLQHN